MKRLIWVCAVLGSVSQSDARCMRYDDFYCVRAQAGSMVNDQPVRDRWKKEGIYVIDSEGRCTQNLKILKGDAALGSEQVVVFPKGHACPASGTALVGNLSTLCQDTGMWTSAAYSFAPVEESYCGRTQAQALEDVQRIAARFPVGTPLSDLQKTFPHTSLVPRTARFQSIFYEYPNLFVMATLKKGPGKGIGPVLAKPLMVKVGESTPAAPVAVSTDTITLNLGETKELLGIQISPIKIVEDSRCPSGVQCAWAGRVVVEVRLVSGKALETIRMQQTDLKSPEGEERGDTKRVVHFSGHTIRLIRVDDKKQLTFYVGT